MRQEGYNLLKEGEGKAMSSAARSWHETLFFEQRTLTTYAPQRVHLHPLNQGMGCEGNFLQKCAPKFARNMRAFPCTLSIV